MRNGKKIISHEHSQLISQIVCFTHTAGKQSLNLPARDSLYGALPDRGCVPADVVN
jgi:hypothetical protein